MNFSEALDAMKRGEKVRRSCWNSWQYVRYDKDKNIFWDNFKNKNKEEVVEGFNDFTILADDWYIVVDIPKVGDIVKCEGEEYGIITYCYGNGRYDVMLDNGECFEMDIYDFELTDKNEKSKLDTILKSIIETQKGQ